MSTPMWIEQIVTEFLERRTATHPIDRDVNLYKAGLVNSLFALELVTFIETRFDVKIMATELDLSRFATIRSISTFIQEKQNHS